jgi:glucose-6-phosphate 1-dehydrogenase
MIEKPFGHDLATAILLNLELQKYFDEHQIYRVDHYLGKTFVRELFDYRLSQGENWYNKRISSIFITAREILTIGDRGVYYDKNGATRDFLQNHLMQMLAIITMKMPCCLERADDIRDNIFYALSSVAPLLLDPRHDILLGQYI